MHLSSVFLSAYRFTQDIQLVDKDLPAAVSALSNRENNICDEHYLDFNDVLVEVFKLLMQVSLLFSVQKILVLSLPVCMGIIYVIQRRCLRTSRQVRLLELESRSAVFSHILETVSHCRTLTLHSGFKPLTFLLCSRLKDSHGFARSGGRDNSRQSLTSLSIYPRAPTTYFFAANGGSTAVATHLHSSISGSDIGVALSIIPLTSTTLLRLIESWATLEISLGAISRLKHVNKETLREDQPWETLDCGHNWPSQGSIVIDKVTATHR
jgi:hypothetical protein